MTKGVRMPSAEITIKVGRDGKDYIDITDKRIAYKRSRIAISSSGETISIKVDAEDPRALFASMNSILKQFRIISSVDEMILSEAQKAA